MPALKLRLATQPLRGDIGYYLAQDWGNTPDESTAFNAGISIEPERIDVGPDRRDEVEVPMPGGPKLYQIAQPRRTLSIDLSAMPAADTRVLTHMLRSGRPLSVGAWYDRTTEIMGHFGGLDPDGGVSAGLLEVGDADNSLLIRRATTGVGHANEYVEHPVSGPNLMRALPDKLNGAKQPKIVPGMIGSAILLESSRTNIAVRRLGTPGAACWQRGGTAIVDRTGVLLHNFAKSGMTADAGYIPFTTQRADFLDSGTQTVSISVEHSASTWARGDGQIEFGWYQGGVFQNGTVYTLNDRWQQLIHRFTPTAASGSLRLAILSAWGRTVHLHVAGCQLEAGAGPTSFLDSASGTTQSDSISLPQTLPMASGFTWIFWLKYRFDSDDKYLFSISGPSALVNALIDGLTLVYTYNGASNVNAPHGLVDGAWSQVAIVQRAPSSSEGTGTSRAKITLFANGLPLTTFFATSLPTYYPTLNPHSIEIGSDRGNASPLLAGLNMPLDAVRLDARPWSDQEILDDYLLRSDPVMQALLEKIQGRYFMPDVEYSPNGPFIDRLQTRLRLIEVHTATQSVF